MLEPEVAFANLNDVAGLAEAMLKYVFKAVLEERADDMQFFAERVDKDAIDRLQRFITADFAQVDYTDAVTILEKLRQAIREPGVLGAWISPPSTNVTWLKNTSKRRWW
ncbi:asparaginyl-tRNA synthetase [Klebsiella quasipneumoniae]|nr:asparaginyl-tRNA synthetase [Klebsiella quasipneumoniae]